MTMLNEPISGKCENLTKCNTLEDEINNLSKFKCLNHPHNSVDFLKNLDHVNFQFYQRFNFKDSKNLRRHNVKVLILTNSIDLFKCILENLFEEVFENDCSINLNLQLYKSIKKILDLIIYSINSSPKFSDEICKNNHLLDLLYKIIQEFTTSGLNENLSKHHIQILNDDILILHNILINGSSDKIMIIDDIMKFPKSICALLQCPYDKIKLTSLLFMANVPNKESQRNEIFNEKLTEHFGYLIQLLDKYLIDDNHETRTYSIIEIAKGIEKLSKFDEYKRPLVKFGLLDVLMKLIGNESSNYKNDILKKLSLSILWNLAFDKENREDINRMFSDIISNFPRDKYPSLFGTLTNNEKQNLMSGNKNKSISEKNIETCRMPRKTYVNILDGLNWILQDHQKTSESENEIENVEDVAERELHFMFSYSHSNKKIVMDIYEELQKKGYNLWIDKYNINEDDNIMEAMAQAVENSVAVIIFVSSKYKSSGYCRSEAQYAYEIKKPIIPIIIEEKYRPDGWLGICIAGLQYLNFKRKYSIEESMSMLTKQLNQYRNSRKESGTSFEEKSVQNPSNICPIDPATNVHEKSICQGICSRVSCTSVQNLNQADALKLSQINNSDPKNWTHQQVKCWFMEIGIRKIKWKEIYNGHEIMFLKRFELNDFIKHCKEYYKMSDIREIRMFYDELQKF